LLNQIPQASIDLLKAYADELGVPPAEVVTRLLGLYSEMRSASDAELRTLIERNGLPA
jgi:hypothetical protein